MSHAILSPSSASRWLACTPSARLEQKYPDTKSVAAAEGTLAHKLAELALMQELNPELWARCEDQAVEELADCRADELYQPVMEEHVADYVTFVTERMNAMTSPIVVLETKLDLTQWVPEGFGTADVLLVSEGVLEMIDLKFGKGVLVSAEANKQLKLYGLAAVTEYSFLYDVHTVRLTIYQPRINNFSSWDISVEDLERWAQEELVPRAKLAFAGKGELVVGDHCRFCRHAPKCRALADHSLELAKYEFADSPELGPDDIADILRRADQFTNWLKAVEDYALDQALNHGQQWPGFKLVEGRSVRKYSDPQRVAERLLGLEYAHDVIYKAPELKGLGDMEKALGKKEFSSLLGNLIIKPQGKPTLAVLEDKRPAWHSSQEAAKDFAD